MIYYKIGDKKMASAVIHLCVAKRVSDKLLERNIELDVQAFSLGAIAPDIAKQIGETKNKSHFLPENATEDDVPNISKFLDKYGHLLHKPFELGYYVHLLTDEYWFRDFIYLFIKAYCKNQNLDDLSYTELKNIIYTEYTNMNISLIAKYELDVSLFTDQHIDYPQSEITEVPMDKIHIIVDKMGEIIRNSKTGEVKLLELYYIYDFIEECTNKIIARLEAINFFN